MNPMDKDKKKTTAAHGNWLIERVGERVDLFESIGGQWVLYWRGISRQVAKQYGFNLDCPSVQDVFFRIDA